MDNLGIAIGARSVVSSVRGTALGGFAQATGTAATALGALATATGEGSVALGAFSEALENDTVSVGNASLQRRITNVGAGVNATDAVNVSQLAAVTTNVTGLQTTVAAQSSQIGALTASQASLSSSVDTLFDLRDRDRRDMKQGVASAMAMAQAPMPSGPGKLAYAVNGATFRGEYAVGGSLQYRLNTAAPMAVNVGVAFAGNKNNGVRVGVAGEF